MCVEMVTFRGYRIGEVGEVGWGKARAAHHSSGESESLYGSSRRLSLGSHVCVDVSSQRSRDSCELRMTGCRSWSHAKLLLAAVVTIVNVQSGSDWPVSPTNQHHQHYSILEHPGSSKRAFHSRERYAGRSAPRRPD